jgi:glutathione synthase/RimK-type ligase-like ATP-grasp enzyme
MRQDNGELLHDLPDVALVNARIFTKHDQGDMALLYDWLEFFERYGVQLVNSVQSLRRTHNKVLQADILSNVDIPVPPTRMVQSHDDVQRCIEGWGAVMIKPVMGHSSVDVVKLLPKDYFASGPPGTPFGIREDIVLWHWFRKHRVLCAQKFIDNPGRDIRAIVVGGVVASCTYNIATAPDGSVRSLLHPARREPAALTPELERIFLDSVKALDLYISCVDLVEGPDGPVVIEVNPALSRWQPIEGTDADLTPHGITASQATLLADLARNTSQ